MGRFTPLSIRDVSPDDHSRKGSHKTNSDNILQTQIAIKRSPRLAAFCRRPELQARIPGFRVGMGFGLHFGWAIEGTIGSEYKVGVFPCYALCSTPCFRLPVG